MRWSSRRRCFSLFLFAAIAFPVAAGALDAQTPGGVSAPLDKGIAEPHDNAQLYNSLRDVINYGAELFNKQADHAGCYRIYQGALISVRPFLTAETRRKIDDSIVRAESLPYYSERAFELRKVLDEIRTKAAPAKGAAQADAAPRRRRSS